MAELRHAAEERDALLRQRGRVVRPSVTVKAAPAFVLDAAHPRYHLLQELSPAQMVVYQAAQQEADCFTAQTLAEAHELDLEATRRGLLLLAGLGLVQPISVPANLGSTSTYYVPVYRAMQSGDDTRLQDLSALESGPA